MLNLITVNPNKLMHPNNKNHHEQKQSPEASGLWQLYTDIDKVQGFFEGELDFEDFDQPLTAAYEKNWASSDVINSCLANAFQSLPVHFIDSCWSSIKDKDIFFGSTGENNHAALLFAEELFQLKRKEQHMKNLSRNELITLNPDFQNPIICILNTHSVEVKSSSDGTAEGGLHWRSLIILPPKYRGLLHLNGLTPMDNRGVSEEEAQHARVFLIDSLPNPNDAPIPSSLKLALTTSGHVSHQVEESDGTKKTYLVPIPAVLPPTTTFHACSTTKQQINGNDCGFWAMYNALMVVLEGSAKFYWSIFIESSYPDNKVERINTGWYLRELFMKKVLPPPSLNGSTKDPTCENQTPIQRIQEQQQHHHQQQQQAPLFSLSKANANNNSNTKKRKASVFEAPLQITKEEVDKYQPLKLNRVINLNPCSSSLSDPQYQSQRIQVLEEQVRILQAHLRILESAAPDTPAPTPQLKRVKLTPGEEDSSALSKMVTFTSSPNKSILIPSNRRKYQASLPMEVEKPTDDIVVPPTTTTASSSKLTKTEKNRLRRQRRKENHHRRRSWSHQQQQQQLQQPQRRQKQPHHLQQQQWPYQIQNSYRNPLSHRTSQRQQQNKYEVIYVPKSQKESMEIEIPQAKSHNQQRGRSHNPPLTRYGRHSNNHHSSQYSERFHHQYRSHRTSSADERKQKENSFRKYTL